MSVFQLALSTSTSNHSSTNNSAPGPSSRPSPPKKRKRLHQGQAHRRDLNRVLDEADDVGDDDFELIEPRGRVRPDEEGGEDESDNEEGGYVAVEAGGGMKKANGAAELAKASIKRKREQ
jgi:hypothetical protein